MCRLKVENKYLNLTIVITVIIKKWSSYVRSVCFVCRNDLLVISSLVVSLCPTSPFLVGWLTVLAAVES